MHTAACTLTLCLGSGEWEEGMYTAACTLTRCLGSGEWEEGMHTAACTLTLCLGSGEWDEGMHTAACTLTLNVMHSPSYLQANPCCQSSHEKLWSFDNPTPSDLTQYVVCVCAFCSNVWLLELHFLPQRRVWRMYKSIDCTTNAIIRIYVHVCAAFGTCSCYVDLPSSSRRCSLTPEASAAKYYCKLWSWRRLLIKLRRVTKSTTK